MCIEHLILAKTFSPLISAKTRNGWRVCLSLLNAVFPLVVHGYGFKKWPFLILREEYRVSSCTTYLIRNSNTHLSDNGPQCIGRVVVYPGLDLTNKFKSALLIRTVRVSFPSSRTFVIVIRLAFCTVLRLTPKHAEMNVLELLTRMSSNTAFLAE